MSPREHVMAVLRGEAVDRVPFTVYESMIPQCSVERRLRNQGLCIVQRRVPCVITETPNCPEEVHYYREDGRQMIRVVIHTPAGDLTQLKEPAGITTWTKEHIFKEPEDYRRLEALVKDGRSRPNYEAYAKAERAAGDDVIVRAGIGGVPLHDIMIHWMGAEIFSVEWAERRDEILRLEKIMREKVIEVCRLVADGPITHANLGGNMIPEFMGPPRFREFCVPLFRECADIFHRKGKWIGSHMDGNNKPWADDLAHSGLDYIEAFTPAPDTDMSVADALAAWPKQVLWINFPSSLHVAGIDRIKQATREILEAAAGTNRLIIGITEDMPEDRWQGNLLAISEVINGG